MEFDLRTHKAAHYFVLKFMNMNQSEYTTELITNSKNNFEIFWKRNISRIREIDISTIKVMAFHVLGSLDDCKEIQKKGLMNLQSVLIDDTILSSLLRKSGITFDIENKTVSCNGEVYNIDYEYYRNNDSLTEIEEKLDEVAYRVFYDFCVNGFMLSDDVFNYGTCIHKRPEFLMKLAELFPEIKKLEQYWEQHSKSYRIDFYAKVEQIHRFSFELDEQKDPPYDDWLELDDEMKIKKWMLFHAIDRSHDMLSETYLYIKDDVAIPPNQIISYTNI